MLKSKKQTYVCFLKNIKTHFTKKSYIATVGMQARKVFKRAVKLLDFLNGESHFAIVPVFQQIK